MGEWIHDCEGLWLKQGQCLTDLIQILQIIHCLASGWAVIGWSFVCVRGFPGYFELVQEWKEYFFTLVYGFLCKNTAKWYFMFKFKWKKYFIHV